MASWSVALLVLIAWTRCDCMASITSERRSGFLAHSSIILTASAALRLLGAQHRFATAIGVLESALFQLSHADESEAATRNMKVLLAYSDADRHLEEMDEALGLFGY